MNKIPFLLTLLASSITLTSAFGQGRFSVAPTVSPGYRNLNYVGQIPSLDARLSGSSSGQIFSAGLTAHYALNQRWSVSVGLLYHRFNSDDKSESTSPTALIRIARTVAYENLQLPVLINYTASTRRLSPYLSAGVLVNYTFRSTFTGAINGVMTTIRNDRKLDDPRAVLVQPMIGIGAQYRFTPAISLIVQPTAAYELGSPDEYYTTFQNYQLGLQTQLKFTF